MITPLSKPIFPWHHCYKNW